METRIVKVRSWKHYIVLTPVIQITFDPEWHRIYFGWLFWGFWFGIKKENK